MQGPTECVTLVGVIDELTRRGFTDHFTLVDGKLCAAESGKAFLADQVMIAGYHRFEGVSDPGDMAILYAIEARSGIRGTLVDAFGVYSDPAVGAFMREVALGPGARLSDRAARRVRPAPPSADTP